jgi:glycosyltransferase involved in cell wall biosynthesis
VEVIVVDDASNDETAAVCKSLDGIHYVRVDRNQRVGGARNIGVLASSSEYLSFLDDDDVRLPNTVDEQVRLLSANQEAGLIYGQAILGNQTGQPTNELYPLTCPQGDVFWDLVNQNFIPCGSAVFRRSCLDRIGLLDNGIPGLDDWDLWIRIAELYPIIALEKPVMIWRQSTPVSGQGTSQAASIVSQAVKQFRRSWIKLPKAGNASLDKRRAAWRNFSTNMAAHLVWEGMRSFKGREVARAMGNILALSTVGPMAVLRLAKRRSTLRVTRSH